VDTFVYILAVIIGLLGIIFRKNFARSMAGSWGRKYTDAQLKEYEILSIVGGIISFILGILGLVGIIK
jgi:hypothetical protein